MASEKSAKYAFQLGQEQLAWAKEQYANDKLVTDRVVNDALESSALNRESAIKDRGRYEQIYQPLEDKLARDAYDYNSEERREYQAGRSMAAVAQQNEVARNAARTQLEGFGIDPSATRYAALDVGLRTQQAAQAVAAGNQARESVDATGRALRSEAINVGRGYPGQIAGQYGTALQAGNQAVNSGLAQTASGAATMGTGTQWQGLGNQALGVWGNTLNMGYQNALAGWKAEQDASSGLGSLAGIAMGGLISKMPMFEEGGAVPEMSSPTQGAATDDVPARLNVGEFVVPKETVAWLGEKHFQQLIEKAAKEKEGAKAKPTSGPALPQAPTFESGAPPRSALPVR